VERDGDVVKRGRKRGQEDEHVGISELADVDCILVAVQAAIVKSGISVADRDSQRRSGSIWQVVVDKVQVVSTKVRVSKGSSCWDWIACRTATSSTGVEGRRYSQD